MRHNHDAFGGIKPASGVSLRCVDEDWAIVKEDPVGYSFVSIGVLIGLVISALLAFAFAPPRQLFNLSQKQMLR